MHHDFLWSVAPLNDQIVVTDVTGAHRYTIKDKLKNATKITCVCVCVKLIIRKTYISRNPFELNSFGRDRLKTACLVGQSMSLNHQVKKNLQYY